MTVREVEFDHGYLQYIEGRHLGLLALAGERVAILHTIYVNTRSRGKGHGRKMLEAALREADENGVTLLLAPVPDRDCPFDLVAWYERHGFRWTDCHQMMERSPDRARIDG